ncbi:MAG: SDR family NAD(P)-dependent oxidoreductase [Chloroflexota bacterium]
MTDIARHLNGILAIIRSQVANVLESSTPPNLLAIRQEIAAFLPSSYGVASGTITNDQGERSESVQILIYDKPHSSDLYREQSTDFKIQHVLLVIDVAVAYSAATFDQSLQRIGSVKALKGPIKKYKAPNTKLPPGQQREMIPTYRLPVCLMYCNHLILAATDPPFVEIGNLLKSYPVHLTPDYVYCAAQNLLYRNPLLDDLSFTPSDVGLSLTPALNRPRACYICKGKFFRQHPFYEKLCVRCGDLNYEKRTQHIDLSGRIALVTGARLRIGYQTALKLLRCDAQVIAVTRFPHDAARRYAAEPDFVDWKDCLHIYGVDFRHTAGLEMFVHYLTNSYPKLDILINNAAQTVRRPPAYYQHLLEFERRSLGNLPVELRPLLTPRLNHQPIDAGQQTLYPLASLTTSSAELSQIVFAPGDEVQDADLFPPEHYNRDQEQIDNRGANSWVLTLGEVSMPELLEVHLVNAVAPALLASALKPLMLRSEADQRFVINVSASEGQFAQTKRGVHPHTNMAKAALNMLTRSAAPDYAESKIYMNSVDPGWVSDQLPHTNDTDREAANAQLPLDAIDGAARICDPIFMMVQDGQAVYGNLFKDYSLSDW